MADDKLASSAPSTRRIALPSSRDQGKIGAALGDFTPSKLGAIIRDTERGNVERWAALCDRMVTEGAVRAAYETRLAAISASSRIVEPGRTGDPKRDKHAASACEFVEQVINNIDGFDDFVHQLLDGIGKGLGVGEIDWQYNGDWIPEQLWWLHAGRFKYSPSWEPLLVDAGDRLHASGIPLEPGKFIVHEPKTIAGYPMITSVMRSVAFPYLFLRLGKEFWLNGAERFAWPLMHATVPVGADGPTRRKALAALLELSHDHVAVLEMGTTFELVETQIKDGGTWRDLSGALKADITQAILGMTDATEPGRIGSYGAVQARKGATVDSRIALDERQLATTIRRHLITPLLWNNRHRWGGVMPPVPTVRWVVASKLTEIPAHMVVHASKNELRERMNLPRIEGGDEPSSRVSDTQMAQVAAILVSVESGERSAELATLMLQIAAPGLGADECARLANVAAESAPPPKAATPEAEATEELAADDDEDTIDAGSEWIDTDDDHRLRVNRVTKKNVFFVDLSSEKPKRQHTWNRAYFLERCVPATAAAEAA